MSEGGSNWTHTGISKVKDGRIRVPNPVFEDKDILEPGEPVQWSYEKVLNVLIVSNRKLLDDEYESVATSKLGGDEDNYRCTVPSEFFAGKTQQGNPKASYTVPDGPRVENSERRHFMFHNGMVEGGTKSCYVFNDEQFSRRFENSDLWDGTLDKVPQFL